VRILPRSELFVFLWCVLTVPPMIWRHRSKDRRLRLPLCGSRLARHATVRGYKGSRLNRKIGYEIIMKLRGVEISKPVCRRLYCDRFAEIIWEAPCTSGTMLHRRAHPRAVRDRTTILSQRLNSICVYLFLEPRPHAERIYADAKQVCWNKAKL
jgi:hypothetical protein